MKLTTLYNKLFLSPYFFTIAIRRRTGDIVGDRIFRPEYVMPANVKTWAADPILVEQEGKTYLFYEAVEQDRGYIAVSEVRDDCSLTEPKVVLKDQYHHSYPFLFRWQDIWYMIPESSEAGEVRLYRAVSFPEAWESCGVLLKERAVDTTVFEKNGKLYLLTFLTDGLTERVTPRAYELLLRENPCLRQIPWQDWNALRVRGAGPLFLYADKLYRPAQISQEQRYGDGLAFCRVDAAEPYRETEEFEMTAEDLRVPGIYTDGLHTYCGSERFEAIDLRCREFDLFKPLKKLRSFLMR